MTKDNMPEQIRVGYTDPYRGLVAGAVKPILAVVPDNYPGNFTQYTRTDTIPEKVPPAHIAEEIVKRDYISRAELREKLIELEEEIQDRCEAYNAPLSIAWPAGNLADEICPKPSEGE